jgi:beta-glucosidase
MARRVFRRRWRWPACGPRSWRSKSLRRRRRKCGHAGEHHALSPVLDLARDPRWGRTEETYSEDPYLGAWMGVACIRGLQGTSSYPDAPHVVATAKHFAAHGHPEGGTNAAPGNYAEREIREFYLPAFEQAVIEAGVHW